MSLGSYSGPDNVLNNSPYFKGNYFQGSDGIYFQASPQNGGGMARRIGTVGELSASSGVTLINAQQSNPVTVNNVQGAQTQNSLAVVGGGGRDAEFAQNFLPYFAK